MVHHMEKPTHTGSFEKQLVTLGVFLFVLGVSYSYFVHVKNTYHGVTSFEACVKAGFTVTTTYPEECRMPGKRFVNEKQEKAYTEQMSLEQVPIEAPFKTAKYFFNGAPFMLVHGVAVIKEDSKAHTPKRQFEILPGEVIADINGDTKEDTVFLLVDVHDPRKQMYITALFGLGEGYIGGALTPIFPYLSTSTLEVKEDVIRVTTGTSSTYTKEFVLRDSLFYEKK